VSRSHGTTTSAKNAGLQTRRSGSALAANNALLISGEFLEFLWSDDRWNQQGMSVGAAKDEASYELDSGQWNANVEKVDIIAIGLDAGESVIPP
jgi:hypothetical protein